MRVVEDLAVMPLPLTLAGLVAVRPAEAELRSHKTTKKDAIAVNAWLFALSLAERNGTQRMARGRPQSWGYRVGPTELGVTMLRTPFVL